MEPEYGLPGRANSCKKAASFFSQGGNRGTSTSPCCSAAAAVFLCLFVTAIQARDLSFEDRVKAQEAIERVYFSHQIGTSRPLEEIVPRVARNV